MMKTGLLALSACALATPALANEIPADPFAKEQVLLRLDGLDLSTVEGQQRLAIRMDHAARAVCGDGLDTVHLTANARAADCRSTVMANIRDQIETRMAVNEQPVLLASNR